MALQHALPLEPIGLLSEPPGVAAGSSVSLLKTPHLQLMRLVLGAGQTLPEHRAPGDCTLQCLKGELELIQADHRVLLQEATLVMLPAGAELHVRATRDSVLLVTLLLQRN